jgi:hypothetical protein
MSTSVRIMFVSLVCFTVVLVGCTSNPPQTPAKSPPSPAQPASESKTVAPAPPAKPAEGPAQAAQGAVVAAPPAKAAPSAAPAASEPKTAAPTPPSNAVKTPAQTAAPAPTGADANDPSVVARIGEYVITKPELVQRLLSEIRPQREEYTRPPQPATGEGVLLKMIGEKAMMMEGRKLGLLDDPTIHVYIERQSRQRLGTMLVSDYVRENVPVDQNEINQIIAKNPKVAPEQAKMLVQRSKMMPVLEEFYKQLLEKYHVVQVKENFTKASELYDRLLNKPSKPRKQSWVLDSQINEDLSAEERGLVLATYDGGQVTLQGWLRTICDIVPPRRPTDLNTSEGVVTVLDRTLRPVILTAEAKARGYDKDAKYLRPMQELEDRSLLWKMQDEKTKGLPEPNEGQIKEFFESHKEWFAEGPTLRVDQIWCQDAAAAEAVKSDLASGKDFMTVWKRYSLDAENYTPPPVRPAWLLYADETAGLGGEKVATVPPDQGNVASAVSQASKGEKIIVEQPLEQGGFMVTPSKGRKMTVSFPGDGRIVYWEGVGQIEKTASKERFFLPQPKPRDPFEMLMSAGSEGIFFSDLWKSEPNQVVGPVKGFYSDGIRWRVVKVLAKTPAKIRPYSEQLANPVKWAIIAQRREAALDSCAKELREKYGYKIYAGRIKDIDPLAVTTSGPAKP